MGQSSIATRIAQLEAELCDLKQQQRQELVHAIGTVIGSGVTFSARDVLAHRVISPSLAAALDDAGITSARQLGKRLQALGLVRVGQDEHGAIWVCG